MRRFEYHRARTLEHACHLLTHLGEDSFLFAGGTDLLVEIRERLRPVRHIIDLKYIPDLSSITYDQTQGLVFGALVTAGQLERHPQVRAHYRNLRSALASLGSIQVRNRATIVGNICRASPSADTIPPLIADAAWIHLYSPDHRRVIPLAEFFTGPGKTVLARNEIVTGITVPPPPKNTGKAYLKQGRRKAMELATIGVAVSLVIEDWICQDIRIALGAAGPTVHRALQAEALLRGNLLNAETTRKAARKAMEECTPISNLRASADYRRHLVGVLTSRALRQAVEHVP